MNIFRITALAVLAATTLAACDKKEDSPAANDGEGPYTISASNITSTSARVTVYPVDKSTNYIFDVVDAFDARMFDSYAALVEDYLDTMDEEISSGALGIGWADLVKKGTGYRDFAGFQPSTEYLIFAAEVTFNGSGRPTRTGSAVAATTFTTAAPVTVGGQPLSSLGSDYEFADIDGARLAFYRDGEGLYNDPIGVNAWELTLYAQRATGRTEECFIEFFTALDDDDPTGVYTVNDTFVAGARMMPDTFARGYAYIDGEMNLYGYYGSYWQDAKDTSIYGAATLHDGTLTITREGDVYTVKGDFTDSSTGDSQCRLTFEYTGGIQRSAH